MNNLSSKLAREAVYLKDMKKYMSILFVFTLFITLLGFSNTASAENCAPGELFNTRNGQACGATTTVVGCLTGYLFSSVTGQSCAGVNSSQQFGSAGPLTMNQFDSLFKSSFVVGVRGDDVKTLQQFLKDEGYYFGKIDGRYGKISARAVKDFKDDNVLYFSSTNSQTPATLNFSCNPTNVPLDVICGAYGLSVNSTYSIDFGDGTNSGPLTLIPPARAFGPDGPNNKMIDNPSHTYTSPGNYTISFYKNSTKIDRSNVTVVSNNSSISPQASQISANVFKNATYRLDFWIGKDAETATTVEFTMVNGSARLVKVSDYTVCSLEGSTIDQNGKKGVVAVYCNYGASATDVFLVAFKNLNGFPVQTDVVDLRKHSVLLSRNLTRVGIREMYLQPSGLLTVVAMVVPEALRDAPGYQQSATEPVTITYNLDSQGKITNNINS